MVVVLTAVIDRDLGFNRVIRNLQKLDGVEVVAGMLRDSGKAENGASYVDIATWNEYGTRRIPSRPFIRISADTNRQVWAKIAQQCVNDVIDGDDPRDAAQVIGHHMVEDIRKVFGDISKLKANAPSTIAKKGRNEPLVDSGEMRRRVNFRVEG